MFIVQRAAGWWEAVNDVFESILEISNSFG